MHLNVNDSYLMACIWLKLKVISNLLTFSGFVFSRQIIYTVGQILGGGSVSCY